MKLPPYITFSFIDSETEYQYEALLRTDEPGYFAIVSKGFDPAPALHVIGKQSEMIQIAGYDIYLWFKGSLFSRYFALITNQPHLEIQEFLAQMASYYLIHIIGKRLPEFERFRM